MLSHFMLPIARKGSKSSSFLTKGQSFNLGLLIKKVQASVTSPKSPTWAIAYTYFLGRTYQYHHCHQRLLMVFCQRFVEEINSVRVILLKNHRFLFYAFINSSQASRSYCNRLKFSVTPKID